MKPLIYYYADESCLGVQFQHRASPGGAGGVLEYWTDESWTRRDFWLSEPSSTNNRMAIRSGIEALRLLREPCRVIFTSDSNYLIRGMREWIHGWVRRGWKRKSGRVQNKELWQELVQVARRHEVDWRWVRGHAGHPQNEYANMLAVRAAKNQTASGGLVPSDFQEWIEEQRRQYDKYMDVFEFTPPPEDESFDPAALPGDAAEQ